MFDYLLKFTDEAAAFAALATTEWVGQDENGNAIWATNRPGSGIWPITPVLADAVYDNTDPQNPVLVTAQVNSPNFWLLLMVPERDMGLYDLPGGMHETDRSLADIPGEIFLLRTRLTLAEMNSIVRLEPVPAGSNYPFGVQP